MDSVDRSASKLPAQLPAALSPALVSGSSLHRELALTPASQVNAHVILRGLIRHWWRILLVWVIIFSPIGYLIYTHIEPTFEAFSLLQVEPVQPDLFGQLRGSSAEPRNVEPYLQTQVNLITSDAVLREAVAHPLVVNFSTIRGSDDAKSDLRKQLIVEIMQNAYHIRVALESARPDEAATIVRAVVDSYLAHHASYTQSANKALKLSLQKELTKLAAMIKDKKNEMDDLQKKGTVDVSKPSLSLSPSKNEDDPPQPTVSTLTEGHYERVLHEVLKTDFELIEAKSLLEAMRETSKSTDEENERRSHSIDKQLEARVREEFLKDPEVVALLNDIDEVGERLERINGVARRSDDMARRAAEKQHKKLKDQYARLWDIKSEELHRRLSVPATGRQPLEMIRDLEVKVQQLMNKQVSQRRILEQVKVEKKTTNNDSFQFAYLTHELTALLNREEQVKKNFESVEFQGNQEPYRVVLVDPAAVPKIPSNNKRIKYIATAGVVVLFITLGLFLLLEVKAERVADPDDLSSRIRSEVYALPPLPTARSIRKLSVPEADNHIEQFIQRLDHVRFALCSSSAQAGKGRCVLITSAIGGEGKTTLAAQLAARCGNAGMSTLLVDADLRRAALCRLLDVPEGLGLSDVLKDEAVIDEVVIRVQGGTFNLLPAGTPVHDTSRVLQARKFGLLIAQLRQLYDLIIIDSPPILPVPDALILGGWVDGAVIAARYDISRFPQVERARRQLDSAGIAVLGTVINGMRHANSYYGRYTYSRRQSPQPDSSNTI